jgi:hypothetical protein
MPIANTATTYRANVVVPKLPPNPPMHPTPLRVDKIGAILGIGISNNVFSIYRCGAGDGQPVGPLLCLNVILTGFLTRSGVVL